MSHKTYGQYNYFHVHILITSGSYFQKITSNTWHNTDDLKQKYIFKLSFPPSMQQTYQGCNCMSYINRREISNLHVFSQVNSLLNLSTHKFQAVGPTYSAQKSRKIYFLLNGLPSPKQDSTTACKVTNHDNRLYLFQHYICGGISYMNAGAWESSRRVNQAACWFVP